MMVAPPSRGFVTSTATQRHPAAFPREVRIPARRSVAAVAAPPAPVAGAGAASARLTFPLLYLYGVWAVTMFDLHFFLGNVIAAPLGRLGTVAYIPLVLMMAAQGPAIVASVKSWVWYPQYVLLLIACGAGLAGAINLLIAKASVQYLLVYYVLAVATALYVRSARQALPILGMLVGQFAWWAFHARLSGLVWWHPSLNNYDGFGGLMVQGAGICFWVGMSTRKQWLRVSLMGLACYCIIGVVSSMARGAFLGLVAVSGLIWWRSPNKLAMAVKGLVGAIVVVVAASVLFEGNFFWNEMHSAFSEGASEGTGALRLALWTAAFKVFLAKPLFGVGAGNFGVFASQYIQYGEIPLVPNPAAFPSFNLHNSYMEILSEFGIVGFTAFVLLVVDFIKCNRALREPAAIRRWNEETGGRFNLRHLSFALEAANTANLLSGMVYASLFAPWFYTTWIVNRALWALTRPPNGTGAAARRRVNGRSARRSPHG